MSVFQLLDIVRDHALPLPHAAADLDHPRSEEGQSGGVERRPALQMETHLEPPTGEVMPHLEVRLGVAVVDFEEPVVPPVLEAAKLDRQEGQQSQNDGFETNGVSWISWVQHDGCWLCR